MELKRELLGSIEVPNYIRNYVASDAMRTTYFEKGRKKLPLKYCDKHLYETEGTRDADGIKYVWKSYPVVRKKVKRTIDFLFDVEANERVISNFNKVGKQRINRINGQDIYSGNISRHARNKLMSTIKDCLREALLNSSLGKTLDFQPKWVEITNKKTKETIGKWVMQAQKPINRYPLLLEVEVWDHLVDTEFCDGKNWDIGNRIFPYNKAFEDLLTESKVIKDDCTKYVTGSPAPYFCPLEPGQQRKLVYNIYVDKRDIVTRSIQYIKGLGTRLG